MRCGLSMRCRCSDRSHFGEPLDCIRVVPADGGFPCGRRLRGDVVRAVVETGGVVGQHQVGLPGATNRKCTVRAVAEIILCGHGKSDSLTPGKSMGVSALIAWGFWPPCVEDPHGDTRNAILPTALSAPKRLFL